MEAEPLELEDGEIVDDEAGDIFGTYKILQRPHIAPVADISAKMRCSDESDNSTDSESDSDSDSTPIKRPKVKVKKYKSLPKDWTNKNDKYKVWCTQVQEESLTEDLISCGVTKTMYQERSVENYNFTLGYAHKNRKLRNNNSSDDEKDIERRLNNKRTTSDRYNVKLRLGRRKSPNRKSPTDFDKQKGSVRIIPDLSTTVESTDADVATDITTKLCEKKDLLIRRVVDIIGKKKAIDFFQETRTIEENGGMMIMNGSRRRTTGGIYFWLVKNNKHIPQEKIREIFDYDQKESNEQKKNKAREQNTQDCMRGFENSCDKDLPALLTRAELSTREIAEQARLRRGEGMDRMPMDSDRTVSNPPPSPVTDDPDHSEHPLMQRHVQDYTDDFLDIGVDIDSMEVL
ncbi:phosphorylated adapter RNA export protein [Harpegnathos saltator]|uniref:Phosphorylated adapter RNA export protein n=1 Tax=Harpegnathos saltator TaxID=610380 RepID=E2BWN0_HARSA|nr:phosphorylated adapter RNA export protein [Harpegnathos saltator]EFN79885.1 RNA U small nuclear RNA export adapter protein [Harpegnathos saltator]